MIVEGLDLQCWRGGKRVFAGINFYLPAAHLLLVQGPNGSGKSSLLRMIAGLLPCRGGSLSWRDEKGFLLTDISLYYMGHQIGVMPSLTVSEELKFWCSFYKQPVSAISQAIDHFCLSNLQQIPIACLSAGQKQRVSLARLVFFPGNVWILDEPLTCLDLQGQKQWQALLEQHLKKGGLVVMAHHNSLALNHIPTVTLNL